MVLYKWGSFVESHAREMLYSVGMSNKPLGVGAKCEVRLRPLRSRDTAGCEQLSEGRLYNMAMDLIEET